ncbi:MAG: IS4 family transposase [Niabella sp.]|nr:IS4 family transposase [Niabella sp.]
MGKGNFFIGQPIFSQLLKLIPRNLVLSVVKEFSADRYCKRFSTYDHLVTMLYAIFNQCNSLREVTTGMLAWEERLSHLGVNHHPCRSTFSDANKRRPSAVFEAIYLKLLNRLHPFLSDSRPAKSNKDQLYIFDATTITLFQEVLQGSGIRGYDGRRKGGIKVHTLMRSDLDVPTMIRFSPAACTDSGFLKHVQLPPGATVVFDRGYNHYATFNQLSNQGVNWVTRLRARLVYEVLKHNPISEQQQAKGIIADAHILLGADTSRAPKVKARLIEYIDPQSGRSLEFLTNNLHMSASTIADLYRNRWQIEVLFKRLKQNYPLKYFLGDNPNAIEIQIWCALIADLLVKAVKNTVAQHWAFSNLTAMIRLHLMTYIHLPDFLKCPEKALRAILAKTRISPQNPTLFPT